MATFRDRVLAVLPQFGRDRLDTLQVNVGKLCNQACVHCHVEAGPQRTEIMAQETADRILDWFGTTKLGTLDITGGAPELAPCFRTLVCRGRGLGRTVIVRHNLTVQQVDGQADLPEFFAAQRVHLLASLPCYLEDEVDRQRGRGVYVGSLAGLRRLNEVGYGQPGSGLVLDLVYNPLGPTLPPAQATLRAEYADHLSREHGLVFNGLLTITNQPIKRFRHQLERDGQLASYQELLESSFNPATVAALMCRSQISVDWLGQIYDCDFNQMLDLRLGHGRATKLWELRPDQLLGEIRTGPHCFACTAGAGSSCCGALT